MMKSMTLTPATTPVFGMPACGHASLEGGIAMIPAAVAARTRRVLSQGHVANFAAKADYARPDSTWRPSHC